MNELDVLHNLQWVLPLRSEPLTTIAMGLSWLGYSTFLLFFLANGYWVWSKAIFYRLLILVALNIVLNAYLKDLFQDPRPPLAIRLDDRVGSSYGLPSGHAQLAVVIWLWLAFELRRAWAWLLGSLIALGVIFSRLYLGVHDLEDVLVGAVIGGSSLLLFEQVRHRAWPWQTATGASTAVVAAITILALLSWPGKAPEYIPTLAGWLIAATWGLRLDSRAIGYTPPASGWRCITIIVLGSACFMAEQMLLKLVAAHLQCSPMLWALIKGLANGSFVSLLMPWVFLRMHLTIAAIEPIHTGRHDLPSG